MVTGARQEAEARIMAVGAIVLVPAATDRIRSILRGSDLAPGPRLPFQVDDGGSLGEDSSRSCFVE